MTLVLDASALLAFLHDEPGANRVQSVLDGAIMSVVNWAEVVQKSLRRQANVTGMREEFGYVGVEFQPFSLAQAERSAHLWEKTRRYGLSLADRACLALAMEREAGVLTADRTWAELDLEIDVELIR